MVKRTAGVLGTLVGVALLVLLFGTVAGGAARLAPTTDREGVTKDLAAELASGDDEISDEASGPLAFRGADFGNGLTSCPQAGRTTTPSPLQDLTPDTLSNIARGSKNIRVSQDFSCFPQNEMSLDINPTNPNNIIGGANDYRNGFGSSGFYSTTDGGRSWYDGVKAFPGGLPNGDDHLDGGGDPAIAFDRDGTAYYADIHFDRVDLTNGVFVARSTNGGFTWSKPCIAQTADGATPTDQNAVCGGAGDPRIPNDGTVIFFQDDGTGTTPSTDKEYVTTGPRPSGVSPACFAPVSKTPEPAGSPGCPQDIIGPDRVYVTYSLFDLSGCAHGRQPCSINIYESYSDDRGHSFSAPVKVSTTAAFCLGIFGDNSCDDNQDSIPTVNPTTGVLWVGYESFNTQDENQYVVSQSNDGGQTFSPPKFVTTIYDVNYPRSSGNPNPAAGNRPDCGARGQSDGRAVLTNSCFRVVSWANIVADKRGGPFANTLYAVISDNRNGSMQSSNTDIWLFKSSDGGTTWLGPTRVNSDPSRAPDVATEGGRDCGRIVGRVCPSTVPNFGNDQWFPWIDISPTGKLFAVWEDRRLDTTTTAIEWPGSRQRTGNYLVWFFGGSCAVNTPSSRDCVAPEAGTITQPTGPVNPASGQVPAGATQSAFPFRNVQLQDVPNNWDYTFRAGIFAGDYSGVTAGRDSTAWTIWTDARNGRSSRNELGRNPACEQSDVFGSPFSFNGNGNDGSNGNERAGDLNSWAVALCPAGGIDRGSREGDHRWHKSDNHRRR
jgi:hypothetical protein